MANEKDTPSQPAPEKILDLRQVGASGLRRFSGFIYEEFLQELTGWKGIAVYKEMGDNDSVVSAFLYAIDKIIRQVDWRVEPASEEKYDMEAAEFMETVMGDMDNTWIDTISEIFSMVQYGYSVHEICYKKRCGDVFDPTMRSKYDDGRIGWRGLPIRSQDTIYRWQFDDHGGIQGVEQLAPPHYYHVTIPIEKMLLFRTTIHKNNPEGRSVLRGAYRSWYMKKNIENIEAIGVERDLAGLPIALVPPELLSTNASSDQRKLLGNIKEMVINVRRDEQEGMVFPMQYTNEGKPMYDFKLLTTGGSRQFDTDKIVQRYDHRIAMSALADFLMLGQTASGGKNLAGDKNKMFLMSLGAFLDIVAQTLNRFAIPRLMDLNDMQISDYPKIVPGSIDSVDISEIADYIQKLAAAGMPLFPDENLENYLRKISNLPELPQEEATESMQVKPRTKKPGIGQEIPDSGYQKPTGLDVPADTTPVNGQPKVETVTTNASGNTEQNYRTQRIQSPSQFSNWKKW